MAYLIPDCPECGGGPIISVARPYRDLPQGIDKPVLLARKLTKHTLTRGQLLEVKPNDILAAYCSSCEQPINIERD